MADDKWEAPDGLPPWEWRGLWRRASDLEEAAARAGVSERRAAKALLALSSTNKTHPRFIERLQPEDFGLDPLGCAECGAEAIGAFPCPNCKHDPREFKKARFQNAFLDMLDDETGAIAQTVLLDGVGDRANGHANSPRRRHYLKELERTGHVERVDEDPPAYKLAERERERSDERPRVLAKV